MHFVILSMKPHLIESRDFHFRFFISTLFLFQISLASWSIQTHRSSSCELWRPWTGHWYCTSQLANIWYQHHHAKYPWPVMRSEVHLLISCYILETANHISISSVDLQNYCYSHLARGPLLVTHQVMTWTLNHIWSPVLSYRCFLLRREDLTNRNLSVRK